MRLRYLFFVIVAGVFFIPHFSYAVTVGPAKMEYSANPGDVIEGKIFLQNEESGSQTFYPYLEKFTEVSGEKRFMPGEPTDLVNWFTLPSAVTLEPGEKRNVPFKIILPKHAPPGGHFAVIWWGNSPPSASGLSIVTRAGILVYLRVSGETREEGLLTTYSVSGRFFTHLPDDFSIYFENKGNTYLKPTGEIRFKNIFGKTRATLGLNEIAWIFLPQSGQGIRVAKKDNLPFAFGLYNVQLSLRYGEKPEEINRNFYIFIFPWKIVSLWIIGFLIVFFFIKRGIARYNRWIVAKYTNKH